MAQIVVLEDQRIVKNLVTLILRQRRHTVRQASTPEEAGHILHEQNIDLLVADVKLADGRSGTDFALKLFQSKPTIKCLFISGLPFEDWNAKDGRNVARLPENSYGILEKPFAPASLLKAVDGLLLKPEPSTTKLAHPFVPAAVDAPWLKTMRDLLTGIRAWLDSGQANTEAWNLYTATAHVCLEEMRVVADQRADELAEVLQRAIPGVEATFKGLRDRDRQAVEASVAEVLALLSTE